MGEEHVERCQELEKPETSGCSVVRQIAVVKVPFGLGGAQRGAEFGPGELIAAGLKRELERLGYVVSDEIRVDCLMESSAKPGQDGTKYLAEVEQMSRNVCAAVSGAVTRGSFPLVLGGDHSVAIGTIAGLTAKYAKLGVIWFDAHADLNTEKASLSGNMHGMGLAAALGHASFNISRIPGAGPFIDHTNLVYVGLRDLDEYEKEKIGELGILSFTLRDIDRMGIQHVVEQALSAAGNGTDGIHVSFDMDCLDPREAPGVGTPVPGGLSSREAHFALELLAVTNRVTSMELVEVNPFYDINRQTARLGVDLIASILGKRIL